MKNIIKLLIGIPVFSSFSYSMDAMRFKLVKLKNKTNYTIVLNNADHTVSAQLNPFQTQELHQAIELQSCSPIWKYAEIQIDARNDQEHVKRVLRIGHGIGAFNDLLHSYVAFEEALVPVKKIVYARGNILSAWTNNNYTSIHPRKYLITLIFAGEKLNSSAIQVQEVFDKFDSTKAEDSQGLWH